MWISWLTLALKVMNVTMTVFVARLGVYHMRMYWLANFYQDDSDGSLGSGLVRGRRICYGFPVCVCLFLN